jgi:hypothetical protein
MALENTSAIDAAGIEIESGFAVLTIADSWDWDNVQAHLLALQNKLNAYFDFVESGQIWESYPLAKGHKIVIDVITRFPIPCEAREFLDRANQVAAGLDLSIRHVVVP